MVRSYSRNTGSTSDDSDNWAFGRHSSTSSRARRSWSGFA